VPPPTLDGRPEVILDVEVRDGLFSITLRNIGPRPALAVTTRFDPPLTALGGTKTLAALRVFRELAFMAPGKAFEQFVDPLAAYVARQAPLRFTATITYRDRDDRAYEESMTHDLRVYLELGQVVAHSTSDVMRRT
jgi:hypothetical protein